MGETRRMNTHDSAHLARHLVVAACKAGQVQMRLWRRRIAVSAKADSSPVTEADRASEEIILEALDKAAPGIPVLAEEAASKGIEPRLKQRFFLVDPLDGTREYIAGSEEFTVNIALVENGLPVLGVILAPAMRRLWLTTGRDGAARTVIDPRAPLPPWEEMTMEPIRGAPPPGDGLRVVVSKSHLSTRTQNYLRRLRASSVLRAGSSLKFCLLAEGRADIYPRLSPTMEWDTAAGHAILRAAGGCLRALDGAPLAYGHAPGHVNPAFIAFASRSARYAEYGA